MVVDEVRDGRRIAQLLASEIRGHERGALGRCSVVDVQDVEGTEFGEFAYGVDVGGPDGGRTRLADVFVHEDRARVEFHRGVETALEVGREAGLRVRPKAADPPRTVVFVESGIEAKRVLAVVRAAVGAVDG